MKRELRKFGGIISGNLIIMDVLSNRNHMFSSTQRRLSMYGNFHLKYYYYQFIYTLITGYIFFYENDH